MSDENRDIDSQTINSVLKQAKQIDHRAIAKATAMMRDRMTAARQALNHAMRYI